MTKTLTINGIEYKATRIDRKTVKLEGRGLTQNIDNATWKTIKSMAK